MIKFPYIILLFAMIVGISSCSKKEDSIVTPNTPADFKYPYTLNSNWLYKGTLQNINVRPDSIRPYITTEPILETGYSVWKNDTIMGGITARILQSNHTSPTHSHNTTEYFVNSDTGLVSIRFTSNGTSFGPFNVNPRYKMLYNGRYYHSIYELKRDAFSENFLQSSTDHANCIKYPVEANKEWYFRKPNIVQIQRKKYLSFEQVVTPAGTFDCMKIARINYSGSPAVADPNYIMYDYLSKIGMVKRSYLIKNIPLLNNVGETIGYFDISDEVLLNSYTIAP